MPHTVAPLRSAAFLIVCAASGGRGGTLLQLSVLAAHGAHAHALEALGDGVSEEAHRQQRLGEEVAVDHRVALLRVVLVDDGEQTLLEGADAVRLRARVALLAIVRGRLDGAVLHGALQAGRAYAQARRGPDALVHGRAPGVETRGFFQRRIG